MQVFFTIITAVFSLGQAAPHFQSLAQARGAAYTLWEIIDTVTKAMSSILNMKISFSSHQLFQSTIRMAFRRMV